MTSLASSIGEIDAPTNRHRAIRRIEVIFCQPTVSVHRPTAKVNRESEATPRLDSRPNRTTLFAPAAGAVIQSMHVGRRTYEKTHPGCDCVYWNGYFHGPAFASYACAVKGAAIGSTLR